MQFTKEELGLINLAITTEHTPQGAKQRVIALEEIIPAASLYEKIMVLTEGEGEAKQFVNGELELATKEKSLILKVLERPWPVTLAKTYLELKPKLET